MIRRFPYGEKILLRQETQWLGGECRVVCSSVVPPWERRDLIRVQFVNVAQDFEVVSRGHSFSFSILWLDLCHLLSLTGFEMVREHVTNLEGWCKQRRRLYTSWGTEDGGKKCAAVITFHSSPINQHWLTNSLPLHHYYFLPLFNVDWNPHTRQIHECMELCFSKLCWRYDLKPGMTHVRPRFYFTRAPQRTFSATSLFWAAQGRYWLALVLRVGVEEDPLLVLTQTRMKRPERRWWCSHCSVSEVLLAS